MVAPFGSIEAWSDLGLRAWVEVVTGDVLGEVAVGASLIKLTGSPIDRSSTKKIKSTGDLVDTLAAARRFGLTDARWVVLAGLVAKPAVGSAVVVEQATVDRRDPVAGAGRVVVAGWDVWLVGGGVGTVSVMVT